MIPALTEEHPIIRLENVTFRYPGAQTDSLYQVSLSIEPGDFIAIAGSNGSGKTTLCKCFNGLIPNYYVGDMEGSVFVDGHPTSESSVAELSKRVAYVFQDFENQLVRPTVFDEVCFTPLNFGHEDYKERGMEALEMLEIEHLQKEWIWQLSGGQKHLVALAAALALNPDVIVVDEPVAQLDPAHARIIYEKLKLLNEKYRKTIVVIEHHTEFIADYCRTIILMEEGGRVRWKKPVSEGLSSVTELVEMNIQPPQVTQAHYKLFGGTKEKGTTFPVTLDEAVKSFSRLERNSLNSHDTNNHVEKTSLLEPLVQLEGVTSGYQGIDRKMKPVLRGIDLSIYDGDRIALIGNNGAGKSTLLRLISGLRRPWEGKVTVLGHDTHRTTPERLSDQVAFLFQNPEEMFIADSIRKDIEYFLRARKQNDFDSFIDEILHKFKLTDLQEKDGRLLSGGQQRRATLAIGMAMRPSVMLLDEPTASLDIASRKEMTALFSHLRNHIKTVVIATHDMQLVTDWATRVIVMNEGQIILDTDSRSVFAKQDILDKAALVSPQIVKLSERLGIQPTCLSVDEFVAHMQKEITYGIS